MDDLISRREAIALANSLKDDLPDDERMADAVMAHNEGIMEYQTKLSLLPSAQTEIIHCRECQHHRRDNTGCYYCVRKEYGYGWGLNDFCSDAERRTDD